MSDCTWRMRMLGLFAIYFAILFVESNHFLRKALKRNEDYVKMVDRLLQFLGKGV